MAEVGVGKGNLHIRREVMNLSIQDNLPHSESTQTQPRLMCHTGKLPGFPHLRMSHSPRLMGLLGHPLLLLALINVTPQDNPLWFLVLGYTC